MSISQLERNDVFLKKILEAPLGQVVTVLGENLNCKISLDLIEQNTPKPGTEFERKIVVSADELPIIRAIIKFDRNVLPRSIIDDLLQKRKMIGTILNKNNIPNEKNVISLNLDQDGKKIHRVYEIRSNGNVLFEISEEIKLDHLDTIRRKYHI
jgi:chorismate-pyruvate lyase